MLGASSPEAGKIGKSGDSVLGESAKIQLRMYVPNSAVFSGIIQWEMVFSYAYTG